MPLSRKPEGDAGETRSFSRGVAITLVIGGTGQSFRAPIHPAGEEEGEHPDVWRSRLAAIVAEAMDGRVIRVEEEEGKLRIVARAGRRRLRQILSEGYQGSSLSRVRIA
ncbi:MAG: hypothetical protein V1908_00360 [Candidatus Peregrinibacteria bacterium]